MSPERNVDIRHVSRENIRRDPPRLIFAEQLGGRAPAKLLTAVGGIPVRKLIVLVEGLALAACIVIVAAVNPQTGQMMVAAANGRHESFMSKVIAFAQAAGTVAMLTVNPQTTKPRPH